MTYLAKGPRLEINNGSGDDSKVPTYWPLHFFNSNWNNGPSPGHSNIRSDGRCTSSSLPFMVWWVRYLNKRLRPEFNNGPEMTWIVATVWSPLHLFETDLYNGPSLSHGVYICSPTYVLLQWSPTYGLLLMVSWQVPHLSTGSRPDFNNDLGADSNSGPVLGPGVYLSLTRIMAPPWATPILCTMKYTSVQVSCLWFPGGYYIWPRAPCLISIMAQEMI